MQDKTCLRAVVNSPIVKQTVTAYNRIEGKTMSACNLRVRTLSQIGLGIPFKAMQKLGLKGFNHHKFTAARSHAKCYGPGQDPLNTIRRRLRENPHHNPNPNPRPHPNPNPKSSVVPGVSN